MNNNSESIIALREKLMGRSNRLRNEEYAFHCTFCNHHKKKLSVNFAVGAFKCWVCDTRGKNIYRVVRKFGTYQQRQKYLELQGRLDLSEFEKIFKELNEEELKTMIEDILSDWKVLCEYKGISDGIETIYENGRIFLNQKDLETIYNIDDRTIDGHINDISEDLRDYLRRRGIKIYTDRFFKSI